MRVCGINATAVSQMGRNGYLVEIGGEIDFDETLRLYIERMRKRRAESADQAERLTRAKADIAELEFDEKRGALVDVRQAATTLAELYRACERAIAADKTGLVKSSLAQALEDWRGAVDRIIEQEENTGDND